MVTVKSEHFVRAISGRFKLPHPMDRRRRAIKLVGDIELSHEEPPDHIGIQFINQVGSTNLKDMEEIFKELADENLLHFTENVIHLRLSTSATTARRCIEKARLTRLGWKEWEKISSARDPSKTAIVAMSFRDEILNLFVENTLKPAIEQIPGYLLQRVDDEHITQAGLIDSIMRDSIRSAPFVIVDLTHDNHGAYWEAGYAEGLGKPVFYICEIEKWNNRKTHFDTEHSTTLFWSKNGDNSNFVKTLTAAIRNTLNII